MKRWFTGLLVAIVILAGALVPVQDTAAAPLAPGLTVHVAPTELRPAQAGFVMITGGYPLEVSVKLNQRPLDVFWTGEGYLAVFSFDFGEQPGNHRLEILADNPVNGASVRRIETITVLDYSYPKESVALPYKLIPLLDSSINEEELARLDEVYAARTQPTEWDWPFGLPVLEGPITSRFGGDRTYNGGMWFAYHTGTDFRREVGEPVIATAAGRVAAAEFFEVRGNVVIIDHGYGVFSQYAHMSEMLVEEGDRVIRGQLLGLAGSSGRSNGPHLHFEVIVNGQPVDPMLWLGLSPTFVQPPNVRPNNGEDEPIEEGTGP